MHKTNTVRAGTGRDEGDLGTDSPFKRWLLCQIERDDACGKLARDVADADERIDCDVRMTDQRDLMRYRTTQPWTTRITKTDADAVWREYLKWQEQHRR